MLSGIALFLTVSIGKWIMLLPVGTIALGVNLLRKKINPTAFQTAQDLGLAKRGQCAMRLAALAGFMTVLIAYQIFDYLNADFSRWIVVVSAVFTLGHGASDFSSGARFMGYTRVGSALGIFAWLMGSIFRF